MATKKAATKKAMAKKKAPAARKGGAKGAATGAPAIAAGIFGGDDDDQKADFAEFFEAVGQGLVTAQSKMDEASREYLKSVAASPYLLPSVYRIPKLTAQMKFALTKEKEKGFNVFFFGNESKAQTMHQQSVEFEIVSAPPPAPGFDAPFRYEPVLSPARRAAILDLLKTVGAPAALTAAPFDRALILATDANGYLLIRSDAGKVGLWFLTELAEGASLVALREPAANSTATTFATQGERLEAFLKKLE